MQLYKQLIKPSLTAVLYLARTLAVDNYKHEVTTLL